MAWFYVLDHHPEESHLSHRTDFLRWGTPNQGPAPACPTCGHLVGGMTWLPPFEVELECWGTAFGDLAFGSSDELLVSERFKGVFQDNRLIGLSGFDPVRVVKVTRYANIKGEAPPYYYVRVARSQAAIDQEPSGFEWERPPVCSRCRLGRRIKRWERIILEPGTWSGEDIFRPRGLTGIYMTSQRFKAVCEQHQLANAVFIPAEEYWHDFYPWDNVKRAEELARMPVGGELEEKIKPNGEVWRYFRKRNEMLIINPDGSIRTMWHPVDGVKYWEEQ